MGRLHLNCFRIPGRANEEGSQGGIGSAVYLLASMYNHDCGMPAPAQQDSVLKFTKLTSFVAILQIQMWRSNGPMTRVRSLGPEKM